jgi:flavin reductase (DIM6/NTAB) family NADH-FMN oxidoreductase RutF
MILKPFLREAMIPLPVTFVSTRSTDGIRNIAPWSCVMPVLRPLDLICLASAKTRDTLANIRSTGQFVVNLAGVDMVDKVITTARSSAPEVDEFTVAGLDEKPSALIEPPGIAGCYAWMECRLEEEFEGKSHVLIVGKVLRLEVVDEVMLPDGSLDLDKARPLMMTGNKKGMNFSTVVGIDRFEPFSAMFRDSRDPLAKKYEE